MPTLFVFLILEVIILRTNVQLKITRHSFAGFIVLHLLTTALIADCSPKYGWVYCKYNHLGNHNPFFCQNNKECGPFKHHMEILTKLTAKSCLVKQANFLSDIMVHKLWKRKFTKAIAFSRKITDRMLNCFYHHLIPAATENNIIYLTKYKGISIIKVHSL